ncbi:MAG: hypothetical protein QXT73_00620 [Candidatus Methanomethylicaceae archaeon]
MFLDVSAAKPVLDSVILDIVKEIADSGREIAERLGQRAKDLAVAHAPVWTGHLSKTMDFTLTKAEVFQLGSPYSLGEIAIFEGTLVTQANYAADLIEGHQNPKSATISKLIRWVYDVKEYELAGLSPEDQKREAKKKAFAIRRTILTRGARPSKMARSAYEQLMREAKDIIIKIFRERAKKIVKWGS